MHCWEWLYTYFFIYVASFYQRCSVYSSAMKAQWDILKAYVVEFKILNFCCEYLPLLLSWLPCSLRGFGCMYISDKQLDDQYEAHDFYLSNKIIVLKVIRWLGHQMCLPILSHIWLDLHERTEISPTLFAHVCVRSKHHFLYLRPLLHMV